MLRHSESIVGYNFVRAAFPFVSKWKLSYGGTYILGHITSYDCVRFFILFEMKCDLIVYFFKYNLVIQDSNYYLHKSFT